MILENYGISNNFNYKLVTGMQTIHKLLGERKRNTLQSKLKVFQHSISGLWSDFF